MANYTEARLALFRADTEKQIQFHANRRLSMTDQHPIIPPPELLQEWTKPSGYKVIPGWLHELIQTATQWGADAELEACLRLVEIEVCDGAYELSRYIRIARRPKPPSLKEEALNALDDVEFDLGHCHFSKETTDIIRRALEQLDD